MPTVLDTHAWIWWVTKDRRLSRRARAAIQKSSARGELFLSILSVWEMAKKVEKGQLALDRPLEEWLDAALAAEGLQIAELTRPIVVDSCRLPQPFHGDPADQIIVATARSLEAPIVTRDRRLRDYRHVRSIWIIPLIAACWSCADVPAAHPLAPSPTSTATHIATLAPVLSVQITPSIDTMRVGEALTFSTRVELGEGVPPSGGPFPLWSSTNSGVILIDPTGKAIAVGEGNATIEVRAHGQKTTRNIQVIHSR